MKNREVVTSNYNKIDSESTIDFFKKVGLKYHESKTIHIILDQVFYHKSKQVIEYIEKTNIKPHYLPPYSPNLNPIGRLWKIMNEYVRNNNYFKNAKLFRKAIDDFFSDTIPKISRILHDRINSNFEIITNSS